MKKASEETKNDIYLQSIPILSGADPSQFDNWILKVENAADITNHPITKIALAKAEGSALKTLKSTNLNQPWEKIKAILQKQHSAFPTYINVAQDIQYTPQAANQTLSDYNWSFSQRCYELTGKDPKDIYDKAVHYLLHFQHV